MTDLTIRDVPDDALDAFAAHAARRGQSVEVAVLELIQSAAHEEQLIRDLERAARAAESVQTTDRTEPGTPPRKRRRYTSVHPTPAGRKR